MNTLNIIIKESVNNFLPYIFLLKLITVIVILFTSFYIFNKANKLYKLSNHLGIKYFSRAFLFFGITSLLDLFWIILKFNFINFPKIILLTPVFSLIAVFYLLFSIFHNRFNKEIFVYFLSFLVFFISFTIKEKGLLILVYSILMVTIFISSFFAYRRKKKVSKIFVIYQLLFFVWFLNLFSLKTNFVVIDVVNQFIIISIFIYMLFIVKKVIKNEKKR